MNDEDIRYQSGTDTPVSEGSSISIIPSIAGGSSPAFVELEQPQAKELPELSNEEISRYSRHLILPEVGMEGQRKLKNALVYCCIGTGGLGCSAGNVSLLQPA